MIICAIPARGGSKRIPGKNIRPFFGRPVIHWAIDTARATGMFDQIVVSTDSPDVVEAVKGCGVAIHNRSPEAASDTATDYDAIMDFLNAYPDTDWLCWLYPVTPLLDRRYIVQLLEGMIRLNGYPLGYAVTKAPERLCDGRGNLLISALKDAGQFTLVNCKWLRKEPDCTEFYTAQRAIAVLEDDEAQDVNTEADWQELERKFWEKHRSGK